MTRAGLRTRFRRALHDGSAYRLQRQVLIWSLGALLGQLILHQEWGGLILGIVVTIIVISGIPAPVPPVTDEVAIWYARQAALEEAADTAAATIGEWTGRRQPNAKTRPLDECVSENILRLRAYKF